MVKKIIIGLVILVFISGIAVSQNTQRSAPLVGQDTQASDPEGITIYSKKTFSPAFLQGFLNGVGHLPSDILDPAVVGKLKPAFWRISDFAYYDKIKPFQPKIIFTVGEQYVNTHGGWDKVRPWENWKEWEDSVKESVKYSASTNRPIAYWDIWGEPDLDGGTVWNGTYSQFLEFVARGYRTIHALDPDAKVIGPSVSQFKPRFREGSREVVGLDTFIRDLAKIHNVMLEGISWHELGSDPEDIPAHAKELRMFLGASFPNYTPEFHVNEFSAQKDHLIPGWTIAWLYYLERAGVAVANRACWNIQTSVFQTWNDCWRGLNGLLLQDNKTPQHTYWVHKAYADLGPVRLVTESDVHKTVALASRNDAIREFRVVIGRYATRANERLKPLNTVVHIQQFPYAKENVNVSYVVIPSVATPGAFARPKETPLPFTFAGTTLTIPLIVSDGSAIELIIKSGG